MSIYLFKDLIDEIQNASEEGITFADKQETWDNADDVKSVVEALKEKKVVHYLKLEGNTMGVNAAAAIGDALKMHPEFRKALWRNMFTRRLKTEIPVALKLLGDGLILANAQLTVLDLSDNALGPNGMAGLETLLRSPTCYTLQELRLNNCGLGIGGGQMLSKALLDCHAKSSEAGRPLKLKVFVAGRNRLENDGAKAIAAIFTTLGSLEEIVMPQNSIYHKGIAALASGIKCNTNLLVLDLNDNTITSKGAAHLAEAFMYTPHLREINFGDCLLKTNGAYTFAEALGENHNELEVVNLGFNEIGPDGGLVLASCLQNKPNLKTLILDGNQFGSKGRQRIIETMESSGIPTSLQSMEDDESVSDEEENVEYADDDDDDDDDENDVEGDDDDQSEDNNNTADDNENYEETEDDECLANTSNNTIYTTTEAFTTKMINANDSALTETSDSPTNATITDTNPTIKQFCLSQKPCTLEMFNSLNTTNKLQSFLDFIEQFNGTNNYLLLMVFTTLKCGHLSKESNEALDLAIKLFQKLSDYAIAVKKELCISSYLLRQLKLLNSEEKFNTEYNMECCRHALTEALKTKAITSEYMANTFQVFLDQLHS